MSWLDGWTDGAGFMPHGYCLLWQPELVALHASSDAFIALAYFAIPGAIAWFVTQRADLTREHKRIAWLFVAFIVACGLSHIFDLATLWQPLYAAEGLVKAATAIVSMTTAVMVWPLVPRLIALPSPAQLQAVNDELKAEIAAHLETAEALRRARSALEEEVAARTRELALTKARFERALSGSPITAFEQDESLRYTWVYNPALGLDEAHLLGRTDAEVFPEAVGELETVKRQALNGEPARIEIEVTREGESRWFDLKAAPIVLETGRRGLSAVAVDITAQKQARARLEVLARELNHRAKNSFALISALIRQSAGPSDEGRAFAAKVEERIRALARAQDMMVSNRWDGADLDEIVRAQLAPLAGHAERRLRIGGDRVALPAASVQYLSLALHELATNATKYGGLSGEEGRVDLSWRLTPGPDGGSVLVMTWDEAAPAATGAAPERTGFGRKLLEQIVPRALQGDARLEFTKGRVRWTLTAPAAMEVAEAAG